MAKRNVTVDWERERLPNRLRRASIKDRPAQEADVVWEREKERKRGKKERR